jgi:hypothetical protein
VTVGDGKHTKRSLEEYRQRLYSLRITNARESLGMVKKPFKKVAHED